MYQKLLFSFVLFSALIIIIFSPNSIGASGFYDGSFVFMGKTTGDTCTLGFMEIGYGECERWVIRYLDLGPAGLIAERRGRTIDPPSLPVWDTSMIFGDTLDWLQRFWPVDGEFIINYSGDYRVREPEYDSVFARMWSDSLHSFAENRLAEAHVDEPGFNRPVELVWRHPGGLYKNYRIAEAILTGDYIFIRTHQPLKGLHGSRHGLLVYRL